MNRTYYPGLVASALLALSAFLPWVVEVTLTSSIGTTGIELGNGWIAIALALIAGLLFFRRKAIAFLPGVLAIGLGIFEVFFMQESLGTDQEFEGIGFNSTIGMGIYLLFISALGIVLMGLWQYRRKPTDDSAPLT